VEHFARLFRPRRVAAEPVAKSRDRALEQLSRLLRLARRQFELHHDHEHVAYVGAGSRRSGIPFGDGQRAGGVRLGCFDQTARTVSFRSLRTTRKLPRRSSEVNRQAAAIF
jgi:hypothetical protein